MIIHVKKIEGNMCDYLFNFFENILNNQILICFKEKVNYEGKVIII